MNRGGGTNKNPTTPDVISDFVKVEKIAEKAVGVGGASSSQGAGLGKAAAAGKVGTGIGWGAAHHAGFAAGGGAGGGYFAGKGFGLKLGLGLGGLGGPILLAVIAGAGSYAIFKILKNPKAKQKGE